MFLVTFSLKRTVFEIFDLDVYSDLETRVGVTQGHRKLYHPIRHPRLPINFP